MAQEGSSATLCAMSKPVRLSARLLRPEALDWAFVLLPRTISETLPRRGRITVEGRLNGHGFRQTLEPDGQLSHWLRVDKCLMQAAGLDFGDTADIELAPLAEEPDPVCPDDLRQALDGAPEALSTWHATTTLARLDWIHWLDSAKQASTRTTRVRTAIDKLRAGEKRVCCFDVSGFYSKALRAPKEAA